MPIVTTYMCPFDGCDYLASLHHEMFNHLLTVDHRRFGTPLNSPKDVRHFQKKVPILAEGVVIASYTPPGTVMAAPPVREPYPIPPGSLPFSCKGAIQGQVEEYLRMRLKEEGEKRKRAREEESTQEEGKKLMGTEGRQDEDQQGTIAEDGGRMRKELRTLREEIREKRDGRWSWKRSWKGYRKKE